jgi:serine/threonine protein kinase
VKLSEEHKFRLIRGIVAGMLHLHKHNIVHRDLAARNILLTATGDPKISVLFLSFLFHFISLISTSLYCVIFHFIEIVKQIHVGQLTQIHFVEN